MIRAARSGALSLAAALLLAPPALAIELATGDILIADEDAGIVRIDGATFAQHRLPDPGGLLAAGASGVAVSDWPGHPGERLIWVAAGQTLRAFDRDGVQRSACGFTDHFVFDVDVAKDGTTLYSVGGQFRRHRIRDEFGIVACDTTILVSDVEDELGQRGISLALATVSGELVAAYISFSDGAAAYDFDTGTLTPIPGMPTPAGDAVVMLAWAGALLFTQLSLDFLLCEPESGVFAAFFGFEALSQGNDLRCPTGIAFDPDVRPEIFVAERQTLGGGSNPRLVRLTSSGASGWNQQIVTSGGFLGGPNNMQIVPEATPAAGLIAALGTLVALASPRRRRRLTGSASAR